MEGFYVYGIVSETDGVIYVGIAQDCLLRLKEHNSGKSKYTSGHIPWRLFYSELVGDSVTARAREKYFKTGAGKRKLKAILQSKG
jgi:putative endonuclease